MDSGTAGGQSVGAIAPALQYEPDGHTTGYDAPSGQYRPSGQMSAGEAPPRQNRPPTHGTHCAVVAFKKEPAGQTDTHANWSGDAQRLAAHGIHADTALKPVTGLKRPAGHATWDVADGQ